MHQKVFPAGLDYLYEMLNFIREHPTFNKFSAAIGNQIILAVEEALVNVINYAYPKEKKGKVEMICENVYNPSGLKISIRDWGVPFNPIENVPTHHLTQSVLEKTKNPLGGYGIYIFVKIMDKVDYQRIDNENILSMIKYFS